MLRCSATPVTDDLISFQLFDEDSGQSYLKRFITKDEADHISFFLESCLQDMDPEFKKEEYYKNKETQDDKDKLG
jgi:hypothetical protein